MSTPNAVTTTGRQTAEMTSRPGRRRPLALLVVCSIATLLMCAGGVPVAAANSYNVYACYAGQGTYLNPGDSAAAWTLANNNGAAYYRSEEHTSELQSL